MTAIAVAMLAIVLLATAILALVGAVHELTRTRRGRRWLRRRRYRMQVRTELLGELVAHGLRIGRRAVAERLTRPVPVRLPRPEVVVSEHAISR
ncbi:hypothetical protein [Phytoactinopolyspora halotolerans]|uniref:Uncharacterized protein n=1 Tax=Phytoactinopolyspora halotolerans TaxID=1981512 RepID=A0A6L9SE34_9ACTN|nr:hypothetical protein [Phytoactinopolyspora halotolerans]NEE03645.1 hypothetical protein [Phytoactinopolyspora halotolerans]